MLKIFDRKGARAKRHRRVRVKMAGSAERPRLSVYRSLNHIYAQVIDDGTGRTLAAASTKALKSGKNAALMSEEFKVVKVDVGRFDRNLDIANAYGNPIKKGIPAAVIVASDNRVLYATRAGELADARSMNADGIYGFFRDAMAKAKASH